MKPITVPIISVALAAVALLLLSGCEGGGNVINSAPSQVTLSQERAFIWTQGRVRLAANAVDEDGDPLTFTWKATRGTFDPPSATGEVVYWVAPSTPGSARITMSVTDDIATVSKTADIVACVPFPENITTMTVENVGAYYILKAAGTVTVPAGSVLTIEPGVVVVVDAPYGGFTVDGTMVARGTASRHVKFIGNTMAGGVDKWGGISAFGLEASLQFKNVEISNSKEGVVARTGATMQLDSCSIFDNGFIAVTATDLSTLTMRRCLVQQNGAGVYVNSSDAQLAHCRILSNEGNGLEMSAGAEANVMTVDSSLIANNLGNEIVLTEMALPAVHYSSIFDQQPVPGSYSVRLDSYTGTATIHMENNYWGYGFDEAKIRGVIYGGGTLVSFTPWLTSAPVTVWAE